MPLIFTNARKSTLSLQSFFRGATGAAGAGTTLYDTRTQAAAATIASAANFVWTEGYTTVGDGGGALYIHDSGSSTGGFQSADGAHWKLADQLLNVKMFGAVGDGTTNDTTAVTAAFAVAAARKLPLLVIGGGTFAIDSVPIVSNISVTGDNNTTIKLKTSAAGGMFIFPVSTTIDNVTFRDLILDGNIASQPGFPHSTIHSIFYAANSTCVLTNSEFSGLRILNIDGSAWGGSGVGQLQTVTKCWFRDINIHYHTQNAFALIPTSCVFENIYIDNLNNSNIPPSGQGNPYGFAVIATDSVFSNIIIKLPNTTPQLSGAVAGFALGIGLGASLNNVLENIDVDCSSTDLNFGYTIDTGTGNTLTNCRSRNCIYNADEFFNQTSLQVTNFSNINVAPSGAGAFGLIIDGCSKVKIEGYSYKSTTKIQDAIEIDNSVYGACTDVEIADFVIDGAFDGIRCVAGNNLQLSNGIIKNCNTTANGYGVYQSGTTEITNLSFDNVTVDTAEWGFLFNKVTGLSFSNCVFRNLTGAGAINAFTDGACKNIHFNNCQGIKTARWGASNKFGFKGNWNGRLSAYYSFPFHAGAIGVIDLGETLPSGANVDRVLMFVSNTLTSGTSLAKLSWGIVGATTAFKAATVVTSYPVLGNYLFGIQDGVAAGSTYYVVGDSSLAVEITVEPITAGFVAIFIDYFMAS